nr:reverse transcriptase domain-containing protein [Tanacetum cinerariifolium]
PLKFNGTEGVIGLTRWFERTKSVFSINNCTSETQVKFASCTLIGSALTWWNYHIRAVSQEVAYAMPWRTPKQMMTVKYYPRGEIKKLEVELWNLKESVEIERATVAYQGVPTCFECGAQGHFENNCSRLGNKNQGNQNQAGNENAVARAYGLGTAGGNPN